MYLLAPFIAENSKKKILALIRSCEHTSFSGQKWPICPKEFFFGKTINRIF